MTTSPPGDGRCATGLTPQQQERLRVVEAQIRADPSSVHRLFPAAARLVGRGPLAETASALPATVEDAARAVLLRVLRESSTADRDAFVATLEALYRHGDADEKRAVLQALPHLDVGSAAVALVHDALRTNDVRLVAAALGPYATEHLDAAAWRHGVLKCLFTGIPLAAVHGLALRADPELVRMVVAFAEERAAAGRPVPVDARRLLEAHAPDVPLVADLGTAAGTPQP